MGRLETPSTVLWDISLGANPPNFPNEPGLDLGHAEQRLCKLAEKEFLVLGVSSDEAGCPRVLQQRGIGHEEGLFLQEVDVVLYAS